MKRHKAYNVFECAVLEISGGSDGLSRCFSFQEMWGGNFTWVGYGGVRTVFLVEYGGRKLAVKTLNNTKRLAQHKRELATLNAVSLCALSASSTLGSVRRWVIGAVIRGATKVNGHKEVPLIWCHEASWLSPCLLTRLMRRHVELIGEAEVLAIQKR